MTQDLFGDQPEIVDDVNKDYLSELVGEGRKYKTPNDLAKAYSHADRALAVSNRTKDQLRDDYLALKKEYETSKRFEELVDQLGKRTETPPVISETPPAKDREPSFDPAVIDARVSQTVERLKQQEKEAINFNTVMSRLSERYGSNYQNILKEQTNALGLTADDVNALAKKSPTAFFKTMGLDTQMPTQTFDAPPRSQTTGFRPQGEKKRDWSYYQELKKSNPSEYKSSRIQNQMLKDYEELGKDFETGDFRRYGDGI